MNQRCIAFNPVIKILMQFSSMQSQKIQGFMQPAYSEDVMKRDIVSRQPPEGLSDTLKAFLGRHDFRLYRFILPGTGRCFFGNLKNTERETLRTKLMI